MFPSTGTSRSFAVATVTGTSPPAPRLPPLPPPPGASDFAAVLLQKNQPEQALIHTQKAAGANPENEVCWYRLSQIQGRLGNSAEQQKALAEFQRLHNQSTRQKGFDPAVAPSEVTKQEVDPNATH